MRRIFGWLILLGLIAVGLLWPLVLSGTSTSAPATDPVVISDYQADFTVAADGTLSAVETITGEFPSGRHGIFRYWDVANRNSSRVRQPPELTSILLDGEPAPYQLLWEVGDRFRVAKIGDPDSTLSYGTHVYELRYTIPGVLDPGSTGEHLRFAHSVGDPNSTSAFFWDVIASSWNNTIRHAHIKATLPADITGAQCSVGFGVGTACTDLTVSGRTVEFTAAGLPPRTPVTLRAGVDVPTSPRASVPWPFEWDRILGRSVTGVAIVLGLSAIAGLGAYLLYRTTVEPPPGFPVQYAPPPGLGPVQTEYIRTEAVPKDGLTATLFYLGEHKLIELKQVSDEQWNVTGVAPKGAWAGVDPVSVAVASALKVIGPGAEFAAKKSAKAGAKLNKAKVDMSAAVSKWALDSGVMVKRKKELWVRAASALAVILAVCGFFRWGFPDTMWGLPFAASFVFSRRAWSAGVGTRRTEAGRHLWSQAGGFHRLLATDSAETRFDFSARKDLYTAYIPFAVAAGSAALWAKKYQETTGTVAPQPGWYSSSSNSGWGFSGGSSGPNFDSFESALSSSIGAYTASQSSSSSSSGGGGGGSW